MAGCTNIYKMNDLKNKTSRDGLVYLDEGNGPVIFLLHGFGEDSLIWKYLIPELVGTYRVISPDWPGCGQSSTADTVFSIEQMADFIKNIMAAENIEDAAILGHSMGGYTAMAFAKKYPEALKAIGMIHSSALADDEQKKENRRKSIRLILDGGKEVFLKAMIPNLYAQRAVNAGIPEQEGHLTMAMQISSTHLAAYYQAMIEREDTTEVLKKCSVPVLFIIGREDQAAPLVQVLPQTLLAAINDVHILEETAHTGMFEAKDEIKTIINRFLKYVWPPKSVKFTK
jgi:pimeloyl-ACP methyl ester carboxylesterase